MDKFVGLENCQKKMFEMGAKMLVVSGRNKALQYSVLEKMDIALFFERIRTQNAAAHETMPTYSNISK